MIILIVGRPKAGKTFFTKKLTKGNKFFVCDLNQHYKSKNYTLITWDQATKLIEKENSLNLIIEDGTPFFAFQDNKDFQKTLVRHRHLKKNIIFNFHALRDVPLYLWTIANVLFLLPTLDNPTQIKQKFNYSPIFKTYLKVNANPEKVEKTPYKCLQMLRFY